MGARGSEARAGLRGVALPAANSRVMWIEPSFFGKPWIQPRYIAKSLSAQMYTQRLTG